MIAWNSRGLRKVVISYATMRDKGTASGGVVSCWHCRGLSSFLLLALVVLDVIVRYFCYVV